MDNEWIELILRVVSFYFGLTKNNMFDLYAMINDFQSNY